MATFEDVWRRVLLRVPMTPPFLAQEWVQTAYNQACTIRNWSHLRAETTLRTKAAVSGTAAVVQDSATVTGGTITFAASDVGRQFKVSSVPLYTIIAVDTGLNQATLDRVYVEATDAAASAVVLDAFLTLPENFKTWGVVTDRARWWILHLWATEAELTRWDPLRTVGGPPRVLASKMLSPVAAQAGCPMFELWPYSLVEAYFPSIYYVKPGALTDATVFRGPFATRTDVLIDAAMAECAKWPGPSADRKNPYFDKALAERLDAHVQEELRKMEVADEDLYPTWLQPGRFAMAPLDAAYLQQTDYAVQYG